jgi:ATP-dependent NAD(P)H-hydrate dehydratase
MASASRKEIIGKVYKMIPPMLESFHKGAQQAINTSTDH